MGVVRERGGGFQLSSPLKFCSPLYRGPRVWGPWEGNRCMGLSMGAASHGTPELTQPLSHLSCALILCVSVPVPVLLGGLLQNLSDSGAVVSPGFFLKKKK
eukprot:RCo000209